MEIMNTESFDSKSAQDKKVFTTLWKIAVGPEI